MYFTWSSWWHGTAYNPRGRRSHGCDKPTERAIYTHLRLPLKQFPFSSQASSKNQILSKSVSTENVELKEFVCFSDPGFDFLCLVAFRLPCRRAQRRSFHNEVGQDRDALIQFHAPWDLSCKMLTILSPMASVDTVKSLLRSMRSLAQVSRKQNLFRLGRWTVMQTRTYALNMGFWVPHDPVVS
ncbi:hypothetical protein I3843_07G027600 [Carya illinoinensis]|nr:hypothetical protein I3843_07G027600 [Carya illinoinensis]KAG7969361.1 hypothetical protein I3843_07G027600 [Carya illinoinensis]